MSAPDKRSAENERLDDLGRRLETLERRAEATGTLRKKSDSEPNTALGAAFKLSTEFVVAVAVGGVMGWLLDGWLNTRPLFLLVLMTFGVAAGFIGVFRAAREMQAKDAEKAKHAPALTEPDEDDED